MAIATGALYRGATIRSHHHRVPRRMDAVAPRALARPRTIPVDRLGDAVRSARAANTSLIYHGGAWAPARYVSHPAQAVPMDGIAARTIVGTATYYAAPTPETLARRMTTTLATYRAAVRVALSPQSLYHASMAGAIIAGMASLSMIYRNVGVTTQLAISAPDSATTYSVANANAGARTQLVIAAPKDVSLADITAQLSAPIDAAPGGETCAADARGVDSASSAVPLPNTPLAAQAREMVKGYPIEKMLPYILQQDPEVAKYLIAIAKQESQWGRRVPKLDGKDCYNYWGYRGQRARMGTGGHTCFDSPQDAVRTVGKRLHTLIYDNNRTTARKLIVWKCGTACADHDAPGVRRWIDVVDAYHAQLSARVARTDASA